MQLASEREELNTQVEAACALVEKLVVENSELVEKVEVYFCLSCLCWKILLLLFPPIFITLANLFYTVFCHCQLLLQYAKISVM